MTLTALEATRKVNELYFRLTRRRPEIKQQFEYFEGKQPLEYATETWKAFHQDRYKDFADNWCAVVARSPVHRLRIDGFRLGGPTDVLTAEEQQLWSDWNRNDLEAKSAQGFLTSTIAKRSAVLVWGDEDDAPEVTWEHPAQVIVDYAPNSIRPRAALKVWQDGSKEFATLYMPEALYKFERGTIGVDPRTQQTESGLIVTGGTHAFGGWTVREVADETWPLANPLGEVPVVEWPNRPLLGGEPLSDIAGTMAMQDAINLLWAYLFNAADHASMPARVVLGADPPKVPVLDANGQVIGSRPAKMEDLANGRMLFLTGKDGKIAQWDAAKLDVFGTEITRGIGHVAAQTQTPGHYLLTNEKFANLNGDALTAAEVPLVDKVRDSQLFYSVAAKETARLMARIRGDEGLAESIAAASARQFVQWKNPAMHSLQQISDAATKDRATGLSLRTILERHYGMTEPEIDRELERIRAEQLDPFLQLDPVTQAAIKGAAGGDTDPGAGA